MSSEIPLPGANSCLFLDVDGTLIEFSARPSSTRADTQLKNLLVRAGLRLQGALALISGRPIATLDDIFQPLRLPAAGSHGGEIRTESNADPDRVNIDSRLDPARVALGIAVNAWPGVILEDKGITLAIHFRMNEAAAPALRQLMLELLQPLGPSFECLPGDRVLELKPASFDKADAMRRFMALAPFQGRHPIFIGDDQSDMNGFAYIERIGGTSISVGPRVAARWRLPDPAALREWLRRFNEEVVA